MRLVLDTNVDASAFLWGGTPRLLLQAGREKRIELFTNAALLAELTDILERRKFDKKIAASTMTADQLVDRYAALAALVRPAQTPRIAPDPDDDVVIGTAHAANADLLGTGDKPLLSLLNARACGSWASHRRCRSALTADQSISTRACMRQMIAFFVLWVELELGRLCDTGNDGKFVVDVSHA